jgi:hypothetical protein
MYLFYEAWTAEQVLDIIDVSTTAINIIAKTVSLDEKRTTLDFRTRIKRRGTRCMNSEVRSVVSLNFPAWLCERGHRHPY